MPSHNLKKNTLLINGPFIFTGWLKFQGDFTRLIEENMILTDNLVYTERVLRNCTICYPIKIKWLFIIS